MSDFTNLTEGTLVIDITRGGYSRLMRVTRVTAASFWLGQTRFNRADGSEHGGSRYYGRQVVQATKQRIDALEAQRNIRNCKHVVDRLAELHPAKLAVYAEELMALGEKLGVAPAGQLDIVAEAYKQLEDADAKAAVAGALDFYNGR